MRLRFLSRWMRNNSKMIGAQVSIQTKISPTRQAAVVASPSSCNSTALLGNLARIEDISLVIGSKESKVVFTDNSLKAESFRFKRIFDENSTQEEIFDIVGKPLIENTLKGYNSTILSYGQTGTGKTYTMTGEFHDPEYYGLIPRTIEEIFEHMEITTEVTISYFEIYNEHVFDLIKDEGQSQFEISDTGPLSHNLGLAFRSLSRYRVSTIDQAMALLILGDSKKMLAQTCSNERSSRSHTIFAVGLKFPHPNGGGSYVKPVLLLVDLAGSENLSKYKGNPNFFETRYINLSLHYLEQVLLALRRPNRIHVPYRNSLMTTFLKNSLGGSCITAVVATFSLAAENIQETRQTCRFAVNVAYIKNELKVNEDIHYAKKLEDLEREVVLLRARLHLLTKEESMKGLTMEDKEACMKEMQRFIREGLNISLPLKDPNKVKFCFHLLRKKILGLTDWENQTECKQSSNQCKIDLGKDGSKTALNTSEITMEKNWRNQKYPLDLPKVNITYESLNQTQVTSTVNQTETTSTVNQIEKITVSGKENVPPRRLDSVQITNSEFKLLEAVKHSKLLPRLPVEVKSYGITCGTNVSEASLEQLLRIAKKKDPTKSSSEAKSNIDSLGEPSIAEASNEVIRNAILQDLPFEKTSVGSANESESAKETDQQEKSGEASNEQNNEGSPSPSKELPLTGDEVIDEEIKKFYKSRYEHFKKK